jgi:hypothetical protein
MKMKRLMMLAVVFAVSWDGQAQYTQVKCSKKEPKDVLCVKLQPARVSREFSTREAAAEFGKVMQDFKAGNVQVNEVNR